MVDTRDESRSRVRSKTPMEDLTMDQYTVEVCVMEMHPEKDVVHSLLTVKKGEVIERDSGHCATTSDNSIEIDISDKSKSRFWEATTGALKKGTVGKWTDRVEECSSINTSDESRSRWQTQILLKQCEHYKYSTEPNTDDDVDTSDESRTRLNRLVLTIMQEGTNQTIKQPTGYDHRCFGNIDASKSREDMNRENSVNNKEFQECKETRQCVCLQTPMELTVTSDSCDESRR